jgi:hypothetical protein
MSMAKNHQQILDHLTAGVYTLDGATLSYVNRSLLQMLGIVSRGTLSEKIYWTSSIRTTDRFSM